MSERALITSKVFKWARESANIAEDSAAMKVGVSVNKFKEWETGECFPTIRQAQILAKLYKRPFALFFLPEIPNDFQPLQDFRKNGSMKLSTSSLFIIREIQEKQAWISDLNRENNENVVPFVGRFSLNDSPIVVARDILNTLNINPLAYKTKKPILNWIDEAESKGIFISRTSFIHSRLKLDYRELQGFTIADQYAPFVFVNSENWDAAQLFTLVHEFAHIWIAETGISNEIDSLIEKIDDYNPIELFCNEVAANALIPEDFIRNINIKVFDNATEVYKKAKTIGVSSFAFLVRALKLNIISLNEYKRLNEEANFEFSEFQKKEAARRAKQKQKENSGGPNYFLLQLNRNGRLFTQKVLDAFNGGHIEPTQASSLLNVKTNKFSKLEAQIYR